MVFNDVNALDLGASTISGGLTVTTNGALTDSGPLTVAGTTTLTAGAANNITLDNANDFNTVSMVSGNTVVLNDVNALDLGASTISGGLTVTTNGALTDSGALTVAGPTTLTAGAANNITLDSAGNNFTTVAITSGNTVVLNDVNALDLGASTISGGLTVTTNGALTDSGPLTVAGTTTLAAGAANNITLDNANDFNTVSIVSGNTVVLNDVNALNLGASTISGDLSVTTGGALTPSGALTVAGNAAFDTSAAAALGSVNFTDSNALTLNNSTVGGNLTVTTGAGDITLPAGLDPDGGGQRHLDAGRRGGSARHHPDRREPNPMSAARAPPLCSARIRISIPCPYPAVARSRSIPPARPPPLAARRCWVKPLISPMPAIASAARCGLRPRPARSPARPKTPIT